MLFGKKSKVALFPLRIAVVYAVAGALWILFSDQLLLVFADNPLTITRLQTFKGWFFVAASAALLYGIARSGLSDIRRANDEVQESEKWFRTLADSTATAILIYQGEKFVYANKAALLVSGYEQEELLEKRFWEIVHPDHREMIRRRDLARQRGESVPDRYEFKIVRRDGAERWVDFTAGFIAWQGMPAALGTAIDITDRKQAEEELRESEARYRRLHESMTDCFGQTAMSGEIVDVNRSYLDMLGYNEDEVRALRYPDVTPARWHEFEEKIIEEQVLPRGYSDVYEKEYIRKDGTVFPVELKTYLLRDDDGKPSGMWAIVHDITERKRMEEALRETVERLRFVVEGTETGLWDWDLPTNRVSYSREWKQLLGYEEREVADHLDEWRRLTHPDDIEPVLAKVSTFLRQPVGALQTEFRMRHKSGQYLWILSHAVAQLGDDGKPARLIGLHHNITERKRAEEALRDSEERLRLSTELANVAVWEYSFIANSMSRSNNHDRLYGLEWQPKWDIHTFLNATHPDDREYSNEIIQKSVAPGGPDQYTFDFRVVHPDQSIHWLMVVGQVVERNLEGQGTIVRGCLIDITERKRTEVERQKFVMLADSSSEFIGMCDLNFQPLYVNPAGIRMVGLPDMAAACQVKVQDYFFPEDQRFIEEEFFPRVLREGHGDVEIRLRHFQTGEPIWMFYYLFSVRDVSGESVGWATVSRDITERKRAEDKLRQSEELFSKAFLASPSGMTITRIADGKFINANESFLSMFEFSHEETIGHTSTELKMWSPEEREKLIAQQLASGGVRNFELSVRSKSGRFINLLFSSKQVELDGEACHITTFVDITERKGAEEALKKLTAELEQRVRERTADYRQSQEALLNLVDDLNMKTAELQVAHARLQELDRLKSMFIASMSHELRTPLNSIIGFTGIILMGMSGEISAVQRKQLGMVKNSANHLLDLINDVIDVSKIEAGKTELNVETFDLSDLAREVKESFAVAAADKGLNLEWSSDGAAEITGDRRRVRQILVNLVGNAVKFTESGGVAISVAKTENEVEIKVRDTGIGMHREDMERLFHAFSRIHFQDRPVVEGTGLGLYLSQRIAALLGGKITAESEFGRGSEFTFFMPWKQPEEPG